MGAGGFWDKRLEVRTRGEERKPTRSGIFACQKFTFVSTLASANAIRLALDESESATA